MPSGKVFEGSKNGIQQSGGFLATCLQHPIQPSSAEHFTRWIARIRDSIGVNDNQIAFLKLLNGFVVGFPGLDTERKAPGCFQDQQGFILETLQPRTIMASRRIGQSSAGRIVYAEECRNETPVKVSVPSRKVMVHVFKDFARRQQRARVCMGNAMSDGHQHCCWSAVPADICDKDAPPVVGKWKKVVIVAPGSL